MSRPPKSAFESFNEIASIRIELVGSDPLIWREVDLIQHGKHREVCHGGGGSPGGGANGLVGS